jgi:hypothetical protein
VECVGARRIAPQHATARGIGATFFTQEYEGRSIDISLIPWLGHRSLMSALLHIIYNPSEAEFREWIQAASRETWKFIPAIKSHIAEEVTIDRCVQRLRRRLLNESWKQSQTQAVTNKTKTALGDRVPSFYTSDTYTSPKLVNLGGQAVTDQTSIESLPPSTNDSIASDQPVTQKEPIVVAEVDHNMGWGGLGLRGNRSSGNLQRTHSDASGLFIDDEENAGHQDAGEDTTGEATTSTVVRKTPSVVRVGGTEVKKGNGKGYIKTSSMAKFYYRKNPSFSDVASLQSDRKTSNDLFLDASSEGKGSEDTRTARHARRRSRSHADLGM